MKTICIFGFCLVASLTSSFGQVKKIEDTRNFVTVTSNIIEVVPGKDTLFLKYYAKEKEFYGSIKFRIQNFESYTSGTVFILQALGRLNSVENFRTSNFDPWDFSYYWKSQDFVWNIGSKKDKHNYLYLRDRIEYYMEYKRIVAIDILIADIVKEYDGNEYAVNQVPFKTIYLLIL